MVIKNKKLYFLLYIIFVPYSYSFSYNFYTLKDYYNLGKSAALFHVSIFCNYFWYGSAFSFNQIAGDRVSGIPKNKFVIVYDKKTGALIKINDGKKTPLILGGIPRKQKHIESLNDLKTQERKDLGIFSLNRAFERNWAGLTKLCHGKSIKLFKYPTTDYSAPSLVDLLRAVRDLDNRDSSDIGLAYVQCKAGRGRSAVATGAYLLHICYAVECKTKQEFKVTSKDIEAYLISRRPQVRFNSAHKAALANFHEELKKAGNFENLLIKYKPEIEKRDAEFQSL